MLLEGVSEGLDSTNVIPVLLKDRAFEHFQTNFYVY